MTINENYNVFKPTVSGKNAPRVILSIFSCKVLSIGYMITDFSFFFFGRRLLFQSIVFIINYFNVFSRDSLPTQLGTHVQVVSC